MLTWHWGAFFTGMVAAFVLSMVVGLATTWLLFRHDRREQAAAAQRRLRLVRSDQVSA